MKTQVGPPKSKTKTLLQLLSILLSSDFVLQPLSENSTCPCGSFASRGSLIKSLALTWAV